MRIRPRLRADLLPLPRGPAAVQLGSSQGPVLDGLSEADLVVLTLLDGTRSRAEMYAAAAAYGGTVDSVDRLLGLLTSLGALVKPHETLPGTWLRAQEWVIVAGAGPLATALFTALRAADVGRVSLGDWALDELDLAWRDPDATPATPPDLVVLSGEDSVDPARADPWLRRRVPHLAVSSAGPQVTIGPLVSFPMTEAAPCLRCLELHRCERDPGRPRVLAHTWSAAASRPAGPTPARPTGQERALLPAAAGLTTMVAIALLDGRPLPAGVSLELSEPWPRIDHRQWSRHPRCLSHRQEWVSQATPSLRHATARRETMAG
ncbi:MAG: hypothetical protein CSA84_03190 [Actinomycetales bacterium]|nr:MAG: hypothetical protein CSA84_03190 [Actinomycetales bacterium]